MTTVKPAPRHRLARRPLKPIADLADTITSISPVRPAALASVTGLALTAVVGGAANAATAGSQSGETAAAPTTTTAPESSATTVVVPDIAWSTDEVTATAEAPVVEEAAVTTTTAADRSETRADATTSTDSASTDSASTASTAATYGVDGSSIAAAALSLTGIPYVYAGASTKGLDCSGLTMLAYQAVGISLPHSSSAQAAGGTVVSASEAQPGDIVAYPGHVAIYIGNGQMVEATVPGALSKVSSVRASGYFVRY